MNHTTKTDFDTNVYLGWLAEAIDSKPGVDIATTLLTSGASFADAEAIALGVTNYRGSAHDVSHSTNHADLASAHSPPGQPAFPGVRRKKLGKVARFSITAVVAVLLAACLVTVGTVGSRVGSKSKAPEPTELERRPNVEKPQATEHAPGPKASPGKRVEPPHEHAPNHRPRASFEDPNRNDLLDVPAPTRLTSLHPESCPPGVDRLGCPTVSSDEHRVSCPYGSRPSGVVCEKVAVPRHAHFEPTGFGWECDAGFIQSGSACAQLQVPAHAHLDLTGRAWKCDSGYEQRGEDCQ